MCQSQRALQGCRLDRPNRASQAGNAISHLLTLESVDSAVLHPGLDTPPEPSRTTWDGRHTVSRQPVGPTTSLSNTMLRPRLVIFLRDELGLPQCLEMLAKLESEEKKIATLQTTAHPSRQNTSPRLTRPGSTERPRLAVPGLVRVRECPAPSKTRASCTRSTHATIGENTTGSAAILGTASPTQTSRDQRCLNRRHGRRMPPLPHLWGEGSRRKPAALTERLAITLPASALVPSIMPTWPFSCPQRPHTVSLRHRDTIKTLPRCQKRGTHP